MATPVWTGGALKLPGDLVQPVSVAAAVSAAIANPGFESGDLNWTKTGFTIVNEAGSFAGGWHAKSVYAAGATSSIAMTATVPVIAGQSVTAACMIQATGAADQVGGQIRIMWLNAADVAVGNKAGNEVNVINGAAYKASTVTAVAPTGATKMRLQADVFNLQTGGIVRVDNFTWNYIAPATAPGMAYKAVQAAAGTTAASEPVWPTTLGATVIDGGVTWQATQAARVEWTAKPVLLSGVTEPVWPTVVGGSVVDGSVIWECVSRHVADPKCPHSKFVKIIANKVYAGDGDIIRYSATANPLDWSTANDAGYLPYGLNPHGASPVAALGEYRSNLVAFNAGGLQMWQVDEDPANAALLDAMPIGSTWHRSLFSVGDDLFFLTQKGVRTLGIVGANASLASGQDVGEPIDPLVLDALRVAEANGSRVVSTYSPAEGQYLLACSDYPPAPLTITGDLPNGVVNVAITPFTYTVSGGVLPYGNRTISAGALPTGLVMSTAGTVTGTPTVSGAFTWTVSVPDADGTAATVADSITVLAYAVYMSAASGTGIIYKSADGLAWAVGNAVNTALGTWPRLLESSKGLIFAIASGVGKVSADGGVTWETCTGIPALVPVAMIYAPKYGWMLIVGSGTNAYVSTDGRAFTAKAIDTTARSWFCAAINGDVIVIGATNGNATVSTNGGDTFALATVKAATTNGVQAVVAAGAGFIALMGSITANESIYQSTGGLTWAAVTHPALTGNSGKKLAIGGALIVASSDIGATVISADTGATWALGGTAAALDGSGTTQLIFTRDRFITGGISMQINNTPTGATWTLLADLGADAIMGFAPVRLAP